MPATKTVEVDKTNVLYNGTVTIDYYEKYGRYGHVYIFRETGEWPISVTGATGTVNKPALRIWQEKISKEYLCAILESGKALTIEDVIIACALHRTEAKKAADKGSMVHEWAEKYIKHKIGILPEAPKQPTDEDVMNGVIAFLTWEREHGVTFEASEKLVYSKKYGYVGTLDAIGIVDGKRRVIDFKTSNGIYNEMQYQVSAYQAADEEESGVKFTGAPIIARFDKNTAEFEVREMPEWEKDFNAFLGALAIKKREKELIKK